MELTEKRKNKFTNWLLAIGLGAICGLMSIGASMINNAKKVSAYEYQDNGSLIFDVQNDYNINLLCNYYCSYYDFHAGTYSIYVATDLADLSFNEITLETHDGDNSYIEYISFDGAHGEFTFSRDYPADMKSWYFDSNDTGLNFDELIYLPSYEGYYSLLQYTYDYHQNINQEGMQNILTYIVGLLTGGIVGLSGGIGQGVSTLTSDIFISNGVLSAFGGMIILFASISLAIGLCRWMMQFLTSLGAKK